MPQRGPAGVTGTKTQAEDPAHWGQGILVGNEGWPTEVLQFDVSVNRSTKSEMFPLCCLSRVCTVGPRKYQSRHGCVCHSVKSISSYQYVIYWFCIVEE